MHRNQRDTAKIMHSDSLLKRNIVIGSGECSVQVDFVQPMVLLVSMDNAGGRLQLGGETQPPPASFKDAILSLRVQYIAL